MERFSLFAPLGVGLTLLLLLAVPFSTLAQIEHGGEPLMWGQSFEPALTWQTFDALDLEQLQAEDEVTATMKDAPWRFGIEHEVAWDMTNSGVGLRKKDFASGDLVCAQREPRA